VSKAAVACINGSFDQDMHVVREAPVTMTRIGRQFHDRLKILF
jgi:hypothetical protein